MMSMPNPHHKCIHPSFERKYMFPPKTSVVITKELGLKLRQAWFPSMALWTFAPWAYSKVLLKAICFQVQCTSIVLCSKTKYKDCVNETLNLTI